MGISLGIERLSESQLRRRAAEFMGQYLRRATIPVQIEDLIDLDLQLDIRPIPGLFRAFDIDAYLWSDLRSISVDQFIQENRRCRYRFSLAHELAHLVLHSQIIARMEIDSVAAWKRFREEADEADYKCLEWQANYFAGEVLIPPAELSRQFNNAKDLAEHSGYSLEKRWEFALDWVVSYLGREFDVSPEAMSISLKRCGLVSSEYEWIS